jgi:hypothetical protein
VNGTAWRRASSSRDLSGLLRLSLFEPVLCQNLCNFDLQTQVLRPTYHKRYQTQNQKYARQHILLLMHLPSPLLTSNSQSPHLNRVFSSPSHRDGPPSSGHLTAKITFPLKRTLTFSTNPDSALSSSSSRSHLSITHFPPLLLPPRPPHSSCFHQLSPAQNRLVM